VTACSKSESTPPPVPATVARPASAPPQQGTVIGKVPPHGDGVPVVVVLEPKDARDWRPQDEVPVMDQVGQTFGPSLLFVRTNQPAEFRNSDDTLHNVHVTHEETREPQFNVAIPTAEKYDFTFRRDGFYHVGCDIHPAMSAEIFASASPYVAMAETDGTFRLEEVPSGAYVANVYAGAKRLQRDVTVTTGTTNLVIE
jgi:plastocyanin